MLTKDLIVNYPNHPSFDATAKLLDYHAGNLYTCALEVVAGMGDEEQHKLAEAAGCAKDAKGEVVFDLDKMIAYKAYQLAVTMLHARQRIWNEFKNPPDI